MYVREERGFLSKKKKKNVKEKKKKKEEKQNSGLFMPLFDRLFWDL